MSVCMKNQPTIYIQSIRFDKQTVTGYAMLFLLNGMGISSAAEHKQIDDETKKLLQANVINLIPDIT